MLDLNVNTITKRHKELIRDLYHSNPSARLISLCETLNEMPEMATCFVEITPTLLKELGYKERKQKKTGTQTGAGDNGAEAETVGSASALSVSRLRSQLEKRHDAVEKRISVLLEAETNTSNDTKMLQALTSIDEKLISQLLEMMHGEAAPLLPQATIIRCMRKLGVPEDQLILIDVAVEM